MPKINNFNKEETALAYFNKGWSCLLAGKLLLTNTEGRNFPCHEILLIHGIELLLSSFLLIKDSDISNNREIYNKYRHDYLQMYNRCKELDGDNMFNHGVLGEYIKALSYLFFEDTIEARYPTSSRLNKFPTDTYEILDKTLVRPLGLLFGISL